MKTKLFLAAIAGLVLAGCVKEERDVLNGDEQRTLITFDSPTTSKNVNTKAVVHGEITGEYKYAGGGSYTYPREESFIIFAVEHTGNLVSWDDAYDDGDEDEDEDVGFYGQSISYDQNVDSWAPKDNGKYYYWPDNKQMSFSAVSPAVWDDNVINVITKTNPANLTDTDVSYGSTGLKIDNFKIPNDPAKQFDLMFSKRAANKTASNMNHSAEIYSGIPLEFQHALSSIHFSVRKDADVHETVVLNTIVLENAKNTGNFAEKITEAEGKAGVYNTNEVDGNVKPEWTVLDSKYNYTAFSGNVTFPLEAQYVSALAGNGDTSHSLLLMPQTLENDVRAVITYTVGSEVKQKTVQLNEYPENNHVGEWKIGHRYTYRLYYSTATEKKDIISFGPNTSGWIVDETIVIQL